MTIRNTAVLSGSLIAIGMTAGWPAPASAQASDQTTIYALPDDEPCLKGRGNCAIYAKMAQLPDDRIVLAFEQSTVVEESGTADGQTLPIYASDDGGDTWEKISEVAAPAYMSDDPAHDPYISNWTNPNLYVLPEDLGDLSAGTLLLASVVSGEDHYYVEQKERDPDWVPDNDGDRSDLAIALYASTDGGETWEFLNIVATGGWQGGAAGAPGEHIASGNTHSQNDPVWEPFIMLHDGELVLYYSDENEYAGFDPETGVATLAEDNDTAPDPDNQVLVHRTWDGGPDGWSETIMDVPGASEEVDGGAVIGEGRPGMTHVVPTADERWMMTFEYFGGGDTTRYVIADDPLRLFEAAGEAGTGVTELVVSTNSAPLATGGSPVTEVLPGGGILYNSSESGESQGSWVQICTPYAGGYSRSLMHLDGTDLVAIGQSAWDGPEDPSIIRYTEVSFPDAQTGNCPE